MSKKASELKNRNWNKVQYHKNHLNDEHYILERFRKVLIDYLAESPESKKRQKSLETFNNCIRNKQYLSNQHWLDFIDQYQREVDRIESRNSGAEKHQNEKRKRALIERQRASSEAQEMARASLSPDQLKKRWEDAVLHNYLAHHRHRLKPGDVASSVEGLIWGTITRMNPHPSKKFALQAEIGAATYCNIDYESRRKTNPDGSTHRDQSLPPFMPLNYGSTNKRTTLCTIADDKVRFDTIYTALGDSKLLHGSESYQKYRAAFKREEFGYKGTKAGFFIYFVDLNNADGISFFDYDPDPEPDLGPRPSPQLDPDSKSDSESDFELDPEDVVTNDHLISDMFGDAVSNRDFAVTKSASNHGRYEAKKKATKSKGKKVRSLNYLKKLPPAPPVVPVSEATSFTVVPVHRPSAADDNIPDLLNLRTPRTASQSLGASMWGADDDSDDEVQTATSRSLPNRNQWLRPTQESEDDIDFI
jgi:hypothetical protein